MHRIESCTHRAPDRRSGNAPGQRVVAALFGALCGLSCQAATITVTTTADEFDGTPDATCSLREAIRAADTNADFGGCDYSGIKSNDTIVLGAGTYAVSRAGIDEDAGATGDLDLNTPVSINGVSAGSTVIRGADGYSGRIVQVWTSGTASLSNLTIRGGNLPNGRAGAGLRSEPGSTTVLTSVVVGLNTADGNAGGILNRGTMTLAASAVTNNATLNATFGGGGIFNSPDAVLTLVDSRVLNNSTSGTEAHGGGIYSDLGATLTLDNTTVADNIADDDNTVGAQFANGGGLYLRSDATLIQSTISGNEARGNDATGGGIHCDSAFATLTIEHSLVANNVATRDPDLSTDNTGGGGIYSECTLRLSDSIVQGNRTEGGSGGGILMGAGSIRESTISGNRATGSGLQSNFEGMGGGIRVTFESTAFLVNSTLSGNEADSDGGGLYVYTGSTARAYNLTVAGNTSNADLVSGGAGGGVYLEPESQFGAAGILQVRNSVLANNLEQGVGGHDDCDGAIQSQGYNLIAEDNGCDGTVATDKVDVAAQIGALADNGGPLVGASNAVLLAVMRTHLPQSNSALVDGGNPAGCVEPGDVPNSQDQRGFPRPVDGPDANTTVTCDIGALEFGSALATNQVFADGFE